MKKVSETSVNTFIADAVSKYTSTLVENTIMSKAEENYNIVKETVS